MEALRNSTKGVEGTRGLNLLLPFFDIAFPQPVQAKYIEYYHIFPFPMANLTSLYFLNMNPPDRIYGSMQLIKPS